MFDCHADALRMQQAAVVYSTGRRHTPRLPGSADPPVPAVPAHSLRYTSLHLHFNMRSAW